MAPRTAQDRAGPGRTNPGPKRPTLILPVALFLILALALRAAPPGAESNPLIYHGNIKTRKFHKPSCRYYHCKNCVKEFRTREEALEAGYKPCQVCKP